MYCYHCGKEINEKKVEAKSSTVEKNSSSFVEGTSVSYVCPRCGHLIHKGESAEDVKSLARASHAEIQRGRNNFAMGMGFTCIGFIALVLAIVFFILSFKPGQGHQLIVNCPEFYVSMVLFASSAASLIYGITMDVLGRVKIHKYEGLLRDIHDEVFFQ